MINKFSILMAFLLLTFLLKAQNKPAYQIYNAKGKKTNYGKMLKAANLSNIILFGELHNNAIAHWLQYELTNDMAQSNTLILGAEMFESDNQLALNQYLADEIDDKGLDTLARLWKNYKTDYAPLVNLAKEKQFEFIATNIPRSYANKVYKGGFDALNELTQEERQWIAPLPIKYNAELACYKNILKMAHGHGGPNLPKAQAIKDATMAYFILKNYNSKTPFIHFHGTYHSDNYESILWYLKQEQPELKYLTISTVSQSNLSKLSEENLKKADYIIVVDKDMTTTY